MAHLGHPYFAHADSEVSCLTVWPRCRATPLTRDSGVGAGRQSHESGMESVFSWLEGKKPWERIKEAFVKGNGPASVQSVRDAFSLWNWNHLHSRGRSFSMLNPLSFVIGRMLIWLQAVELSLQLTWTNEVNKIMAWITSWRSPTFQDQH